MHQTRIAICADDYGISPAVDEAIISLVRKKRLSALSCMTAFENWPNSARRLNQTELDKVDVGLHVTLTNYPSLSGRNPFGEKKNFSSPGKLVLASYSGQLNYACIRDEIAAQLDHFEQERGHPPDFIDGHHHVHQLPVVSRALIDLVDERGLKIWVRNCGEKIGTILSRKVAVGKTLFLMINSLRLRRECFARDLKTNTGFAGCYDLTNAVEFRTLFKRFLSRTSNGTLLMCHPGGVDDTLRQRDSLVEQRVREADYLAGSDFLNDLAEAGVALVRLSQISHQTQGDA